ncbi:MAG: hypothetical protein ACJ8DI_19635 [Ktedonobacteraceae bacterium]
MLLNLGPQHPSTHGVLRLVLTLEGETVLDCTPVIGYLHRGIEKTLENRPYMAYREVPVQVQTRQEGDCYARNAVRFQEIQESIRLCRVAIDHLLPGPISTRTPVALRPPRGETYFAIESSKGELGVYLISDGSEYPWRAKLRGPSFVNLQVLPELLHGYKMSDVIAVLGSLDFVVGEVDR